MREKKTDIRVKVLFNIKNPEKTKIKTNANKEGLKSLLENWIRSQFGKGKDTKEANKKDQYRIVLGLNMSNDTFYVESDTNNEGLTLGIITYVFQNLDKVKVELLG